MDRPKIVDEYREACLQKNLLDKKIEELKPEIKNILNETGGYNDLYYQDRTKTVYHDDLIFQFLQDNYPDHVEALTKKTVDIDKLGEYTKLGLIDLSELPPEAASVETTQSICTKAKKEKDATTDE